jgi:hypothetical protein
MDTVASVPNWVTLLIQVPLVGVFIWYSLQMNARQLESQREFMAALEKRDAAFEHRNTAVIDAISHLNAAICAQLKALETATDDHDRFVRDNVQRKRTQQ